MSEHQEEQEMEAEALQAIFENSFEIISHDQPFQWAVKLVPIDCGGDDDEENLQNCVGIKLLATIPLSYPEVSPELEIEILKGLGEEHRSKLLDMAMKEAEANLGMPAIFALCEVLREWLSDNNVKGLDDASMHAQMMRRAKEEENKKVSFRALTRCKVSRTNFYVDLALFYYLD
jgi:RWD domain